MYHIVSLPCCRLLDARSSWICRVTKSSFFGRWVELVFAILYELLVQRHIWFAFSFYFFRHSFHNDLVNLLAYKIRNVVIFYYCLQFLLQWVWLLLSPWLPLLLLCSLFWTIVTFAKKLFFSFWYLRCSSFMNQYADLCRWRSLIPKISTVHISNLHFKMADELWDYYTPRTR